MAIPTLSGSYIDETYVRLVQVSGSEFADGLGNPISFGNGTLSGGINGYIPVWSGSTALSNSFLNQSGGILKTTSGSIDVGLKLDFQNNTYVLGDITDPNNNGFIRVARNGTGMFSEVGDYPSSFSIAHNITSIHVVDNSDDIRSESTHRATFIKNEVIDDTIPTSTTINQTSVNIQITGSVLLTGSFEIEETKTVFKKVTIASIGLTTLASNDTGSYSAALGKYTINNGVNTRAGEFMTAWNGSQIVTTDTSTTDIGSTTDIAFTSSLSAGQIIISVNAQTTGWNIKMLTTYI